MMRVMALALLFAIPLTPNQQSREKQIHIIPTSDVVKVAWMAARDEGYDPNAVGTFLDELRVKGNQAHHRRCRRRHIVHAFPLSRPHQVQEGIDERIWHAGSL